MAKKIDKTIEELELISVLSSSAEWRALKLWMQRAIKNVMIDSMRLKMSQESDRHAHSNYTGQIDAYKWLIKEVEKASKKLEKVKEKEKDAS